MTDVSSNLAASISRLVTEEGLLLKTERDYFSRNIVICVQTYMVSYKNRVDFFLCVCCSVSVETL